MKKKTIIFSVVAAFVVIGAIGSAIGGNSSKTDSVPESSSVSQSSSSESKEEQTPKDENSVGIDGVLKAHSFDFTIVDVKWTDELKTSVSTFTPEDEGKSLLCIIFSAKNTTDSTQNVENIGFNAYVDGKRALPALAIGRMDDAMILIGAVSSGMEMVGYSVWEIPKDWKEFQTSYIDAGTALESKQHFVIHREDIK